MSGRGDTVVTCTTCGREEGVSFAHCLGHGWPKCCGQTMRMERTEADIDAAVGEVMMLAQVVRDSLRRALGADEP